ncbi:MAG: response regulator [Deltaproteobacteria bacterium]|nr:MAG: response regulator [Deltaproteobacteria bacterium]
MAPTVDQTYQPKVLVIDDEKRIREGCFKILTKENCLVDMAESGETGLSMIAKKHYDIILTDLMMPGIGGMEVLAKVREQHPDTVGIVITGFATLEHSIEAMKKGAFDFIPKPFTPDQVRVVVSKAVRMTRTLQDIATEKTRLKTIVNYLEGGVLVTDTSKNIILYNPALLTMLGYDGEPLDDQPLSALTTDETLTGMIDSILGLEVGEFKVLSAEILPGDGGKGLPDERYLRAQSVPFQNRSGEILGSVTIIDDISHLKKLDEMNSAFVNMVAHEIRGPLSTVLSQVKILTDGLAGDLGAKQADILGKISRKVEGLVELTNELLDLSRIEAGLIVQDKQQVQLMDILNGLVEFMQARAKEKNISLTLNKADLPLINADGRSMEEVFSNLITNAINYTPVGGKITLEGEVTRDFVHIGITDTGYGIPADELPRIFEQFYRVKTDKTRNIVGTGLGLPIVKSIVEAHNGTIKAESKEGAGSTFSVRLPVR